ATPLRAQAYDRVTGSPSGSLGTGTAVSTDVGVTSGVLLDNVTMTDGGLLDASTVSPNACCAQEAPRQTSSTTSQTPGVGTRVSRTACAVPPAPGDTVSGPPARTTPWRGSRSPEPTTGTRMLYRPVSVSPSPTPPMVTVRWSRPPARTVASCCAGIVGGAAAATGSCPRPDSTATFPPPST